MRPILILTKNILSDQDLQKQLQYMNYEVFCSAELLRQLLIDQPLPNLTRTYYAIILSDTVTDYEIQQVMPKLKSARKNVFRQLHQIPKKADQKRLSQLGIDHYIWKKQSSDILRENLALLASSSTGMFHAPINQPREIIELQEALTGKEKIVFDCLFKNKDRTVSREDLIASVWEEPVSLSRLSHVSNIVRSINRKMHAVGFSKRSIETIWGIGYQLSTKFIGRPR